LSLRLDTLAAAVDAVPGRVVDEMVARGLGGGSGGRVDPVAASVRAAREGRVVGRPVWQWGAGELGVHAAIEVAGAEGVVPYVRRAHDEDLAAAITGVAGSGRPGVVVVEGTSCAGKSRALFEAITGDPAVRQWQLVVPGEPAPPDPAVLGDVVAAGVPAGTVVWLDELQRWLPRTKQGVRAAELLGGLLAGGDQVGPVLIAGTVWPANWNVMTNRPSPEQSDDGADAIGAFLSHAREVHAKDVFTDTDLAHADVTDPRWQVAAAAAARLAEGRKITQVLAGGPQLERRMSVPVSEGGFSDAAKAILLACGDLRRVGMDNPLPLWAIRGAAPGYLDPPDPTRPRPGSPPAGTKSPAPRPRTTRSPTPTPWTSTTTGSPP
jgi:hypothetical protein